MNSYKRQLDAGVVPALPAVVDGLAHPERAHDGVLAGANANDLGRAAVVADIAVHGGRLQRLKLLFECRGPALALIECRFQLSVLRLKIRAKALLCRALFAQEPKSLAKDRRTAVLVDEFLHKFEWVHGVPVIRVAAERARLHGPAAPANHREAA